MLFQGRLGSHGLGRGLRICISYKFPAGPRPCSAQRGSGQQNIQSSSLSPGPVPHPLGIRPASQQGPPLSKATLQQGPLWPGHLSARPAFISKLTSIRSTQHGSHQPPGASPPVGGRSHFLAFECPAPSLLSLPGLPPPRPVQVCVFLLTLKTWFKLSPDSRAPGRKQALLHSCPSPHTCHLVPQLMVWGYRGPSLWTRSPCAGFPVSPRARACPLVVHSWK